MLMVYKIYLLNYDIISMIFGAQKLFLILQRYNLNYVDVT